MKKIFKGLSVLVATAALGAGIATATACNGGNGTFNGEYHYVNSYGQTYGIVVEVTVENNIIKKVTDVTNTDNAYAKSVQVDADGNAKTWTTVSPGWETYFESGKGWLLWTTESKNDDGTKVLENATLVDSEGNAAGDFEAGAQYYRYTDAEGKVSYTQFVKYDGSVLPAPAATGVYSYSWTNADAAKWTNYENWLLQQYVGWSVADIIDIDVFYSSYGEPYSTKDGYNAELLSSGLLISSSTQGSGRLLLAVQNALGK
ncbi:MAG: hypothetical protein K2I29_01645 [Clostridia bacterium]|nr:hypothetical protein [Clostridia bacterium]